MELTTLFGACLAQEKDELREWADHGISFLDQERLAGEAAGKIPQERMPAMAHWVARLLSSDDREGVMRLWAVALAAPVFRALSRS
jgi:hypothetical protein